MLMIMNIEMGNGPQPNYGPTPPPVPNFSTSFNNNSKKNKIIVGIGILVVIIGLIIGFFVFTGKEDPAVASMKNVIAAHMEISRVSEIALGTDTISGGTKNIAATANSVARSNIYTSTTILSEDFNAAIDKKFSETTIDSTNDEQIKQGELLNRVDETYQKLLRQLLTNAYTALKGVETQNPEVQKQLDEMAQSNKDLFESIETKN